jgi:predicted MFS family arabinose efflux permease
LTPLLIEELGISHAAMGVLISAYFFVYGVMQVPSGILSEALGARRTIIWFTTLTVIGVFLFWLSRSYTLLFIAQFLVGVGSSVFYINAVRLVSASFPVDKKATAIGVLSAASGLGMFVTYMGFPIAVELFGGWRILYLTVCIILLVSWILNFIVIKPHINTNNIGNEGSTALIPLIQSTLKDKRIYPYLLGFILSSSGWVLLNWTPQFLTDVRGFSYLQIGQITSIGTIAGIPGCIIVAAVSDRLRKRKLPLLGFSTLFILSIVVFVNLPASFPVYVFSFVNFMIGFAGSFWVLYFSMIPEVLPPNKAAIGLGLVNGIGTIGFSVMAPIYGAIVDITGSYTVSNLVIQGSVLLLPFVFHLFMKESYGETPIE